MSFIEPIKVLLGIIKSEMELDNDRVLIYNQKWTLPNEKGILVYLSPGNPKVFSTRTSFEDRDTGFYEVQDINISENIIIDILSYDSTARIRKEELILALTSMYSQQQQETNSIKIARIPTGFNDISSVEASARLNRYNIIIPVFSWRTKEKIVEYFDNFSYEISANK